MTTGEMSGWTNRFNEILSGPVSLREHRLSNLMSDLEQAYGIPIINNEEFNNRNPHVIQLYRTISDARLF